MPASFPRSPLFMDASRMEASVVMAYIGPGAGLGSLGALLGILGALLLLVIGFVWYPSRRLARAWRGRRRRKTAAAAAAGTGAGADGGATES